MATNEFAVLRTQLQQQRAQHGKMQDALLLAREKRRRLKDAMSLLERRESGEDEGAPERARLEEQLPETDREIDRIAGRAEVVERELVRTLERFGHLADPRRTIQQLDDTFPILLLPLRMETRFRRLEGRRGTRHELWVRVYPDDCAVNTFEPELTEAEVRSARRYWEEVWRAGADEAGRVAAWRNLVASHGGGRALWIVQRYEPLEGKEPPARAAGEVVLVIGTSQPLAGSMAGPAATFWEAVWRAEGDAAARDAAHAALIDATDAESAALIMERYRPFNLDDEPPGGLTRATTAVRVLTVTFAPDDETPMRRQSWSRAPHVDVLPDRLVLMGYAGGSLIFEQVGNLIPSPLIAGPDPLGDPGDQIHREGDEIDVGADMRWMVDFEEAAVRGMGFRVGLTPAQYARGLDRLLVLGVRLSADEEQGRRELEHLLRAHHHGSSGLRLLRQGTPTNNTDDGDAAWSTVLNPDASFAIVSSADGLFTPEPEWFDRSDGQWLGQMLGIDLALMQRVEGADQCDVREAQAMNAALFPATIGYFMDTMMAPVFAEADVDFVRDFYTRFVSGRGMLSALRIGRQPYGILPATVYSRMSFGRDPFGRGIAGGASPHLVRLHEVLMRAHRVWGEQLPRVAAVGQPGDPHQTLLEVLGLHATSEEFDQRWAESLDEVMNRLNLQGWLQRLRERLRRSTQGVEILGAHGYDPSSGRPPVLDKFFLRKSTPINGANLVHDLPLSETEGIRPYTTDGRDYVEWLAAVAGDGLEPVRTHAGFASPPTPLLYRLLRHAITLGYHDASVRKTQTAQNLPSAAVRALRRDPTFVHVSATSKVSESRYELLYRSSATIGGQAESTVADHIATRVHLDFDLTHLREQLAALRRLRGLPSARLERLLVEHLDTCGYRVDAWLQGLVHMRLAQLRGLGGQAAARQGVYLGGFGWLEDVRPSSRAPQPVRLDDPDLVDVFQRDGDPPLMHQPDNGGYVHAPSPNHAVTAAVLRSGFRTTATPSDPGAMAINLSSERVRSAMAVIGGIRNGQTLGALLGYQLERGLHDRYAEAEVDRFIFKLRKAFPLVADGIRDTARPVDDAATSTDESIEAIEARNVIDGVKLAEHIRKSNRSTYPFGKEWLPTATPPQQSVINGEVRRMLDTLDAVADLGVAEGIHQVVQGNYDRAAASMDAFTSGEIPPIPEVVQTPRSGLGLTHRVGLHLRPGLGPTASPVALPVTPRASAEPALNHWLATVLPPPDRVGVRAEWSDGTGATDQITVTQADLGLQPIDLLYLLDVQVDQAMTALDDRIVRHVAEGRRPDTAVRIRYTDRLAAPMVSMFEVAALVGELRTIVLGSRPLRSGDLALPSEGEAGAPPPPEYRHDRLAHVAQGISAAGGPLEALRMLADDLEPQVEDLEANRAALAAGIDGWIDRFVAAAADPGLAGVTSGGYGMVLALKRDQYGALLDEVRTAIRRWSERLAAAADRLTDYDALPAGTTDDTRFGMLAEIEPLLAVEPTDPLPPTPAAYRAVLDNRAAELTAFRAGLEAVLGTGTTSLATLIDEIAIAATDIGRFDTVTLELEVHESRLARLAEDLFQLARGMVDEAEKRLATAADALTEYAAATDSLESEKAFTAAAHALLGNDFLVIPEFRLAAAAAPELKNAYDGRAALLTHLEGPLGVDFPVDEWLYGVARVRPPMRRWEAATMLADALAGRSLSLEPIQLPYRPADFWLALPFPESVELDTDRLLYTAHYTDPLDPHGVQCGLLLDEWTEVIPAADETTGITFHYDRPNSEPPQVMLLATTPQVKGRWEWKDLVDTLHETLELAKLRAVEPDHLAATSYARFVPATIAAATMSPITVAINYAVANDVYQHVTTRIINA